VASEFDMHPLAVEDAIAAHQRPKLEHYGDLIFAVLRPARYVDSTEKVEFGELHVFVGPEFVVSIRHAESPDLARVRARLERSPDLLCLGPYAVLYAILDQVVDEYAPVIAGLENDVDEIEDQLFSGEPGVTRRIYELTREVIALQRATHPLVEMMSWLHGWLESHDADVELQRLLRDVDDHVIRDVDRVDGFRSLLHNALTVHATLVGQRQNDEMRSLTQTSLDQNEQVKRISSWAAILFGPTLVGTIYGMNFQRMPELAWRYGYPLALGAMVVIGVIFYLVFKHKRWL
jgi:magnesium transporter